MLSGALSGSTTRNGRATLPALAELAERDQWVCWRTEQRGNAPKPTKVPYQVDGAYASSTNPATWTTQERALEAFKAGGMGFHGVGYVFSAEDPYVGVDLDGVIGDDGEMDPLAAQIVADLATYCEASPSGRGVKLFCRGRMLDGWRRKVDAPWGDEAEMYDDRRYFTVTGNAWPGAPTEIRECQAALERTYAALWDTRERSNGVPTGNGHLDDEAARRVIAHEMSRPGANLHDAARTAFQKLAGAGMSEEKLAPYAAVAENVVYTLRGGIPDARLFEENEAERMIPWAVEHPMNGSVDLEEVDYAPRLGAYPEFPLDALPEPARGLVDYGSRAGLPVPLVAGAALGSAAGAIGGNAEVRLAGGWRERAILWVALLGEPGAGKTPAMDLAFAPVRAWDAEMHLWLAKAIEEAENGSDRPEDRRVRVDDVTIEAVRDRLDARGGASVLDADELGGFLRSLGQYKRGQGSDRDRALTLWTGRQWSADRAGGTDVLIARPTLTICGGLQVERHDLLGPDGDGSRVRWLPFATPELAEAATTEDEPPQAWGSTLRGLLTTRAVERCWTLDPRAAGLFSEHRRQFKARMYGGQTATVSGALAKADVAMGRYALVLAEIADPGGETRGTRISAPIVAAAARLVEFNLACWRALPEQDEMALSYADRELNPRVGKLIAWLERRRGPATRRDLLRAKVAGCRNASDLDTLLGLYGRNYPGSVESGVVPEGGGPSTTVVRAPVRG